VNLEKVAARAIEALGVDATIEKVTDYVAIAGCGVMRTPALVIDEEVVVSGRVPTQAEVQESLAVHAG